MTPAHSARDDDQDEALVEVPDFGYRVEIPEVWTDDE